MSKSVALEVYSPRIMRFHDGVKKLIGYVKFANIAGKLDDHRELNVRDPKLSTDIAKTLLSEAEMNLDFHLNNTGITCVADSIRKSDIAGKVSIVNVNFGQNGSIINGGHTYRVISQVVEKENRKPTSKRSTIVKANMVPIEIFVKLSKERIVNMIEARNTSLQVTPYCFDNLRGVWNCIQKQSRFSPLIAFKTEQSFEPGHKDNPIIKVPKSIEHLRPIALDHILRVLMFVTGNGIQFGKQNIVSFYRKEENKNFLQSLVPIMDQCLEMYDIVHFHIEDNYAPRIGKKWKKKEDGPIANSYFNRETRAYTYPIPKHIIFAILNGISGAITEEKGMKKFSDDFEVSELLESDEFAEMVDMTLNKALGMRNEASKVMHDKDFLKSLIDKVELWLFRKKA